jgi:ketosteroid isomerase-like protein
MLQYYGPDENLIFYDFGGQLRGREEIRAHFAPIFAAARKIQVRTPASFVDSDGLIGIQISRHHIKIEEKDGGTKIVDLRRSDCLRRVNGKWYSMLSMISLPTARVNWQDPKSIVSPTEGITTHATE